MKILAVGINHKTSAIETREKFFLTPWKGNFYFQNSRMTLRSFPPLSFPPVTVVRFTRMLMMIISPRKF